LVLLKVDTDYKKIDLFSFKIDSNYPIEIDKKMSSIYGACSSTIGAVAKEYTPECSADPQFLEHCKRFLLKGVLSGFYRITKYNAMLWLLLPILFSSENRKEKGLEGKGKQ